MDDYRGKMCILDGMFLAKCVGQDFMYNTLTFEVEPGGTQFTRESGAYGVEVQEEKEPGMDDVRHLLRKVGGQVV